jgi:thiamine biosynthesis lipoprotein
MRTERSGPEFRSALPALVAVAFLIACSSDREAALRIDGRTMGTSWSVQLAHWSSDADAESLRARIEERLERINAEMSTWRIDSTISRFNRAEAGTAMTIPHNFARVLDHALILADATGGAFDPTIGPLVNLWGFGPPMRRQQVPSEQELAEARKRVGYQRLEFDRDARRLVQPGGVTLDLSAIAKGFAVDRIAELLHERGIQDFLINLGGDVRAAGARADGSAWRIGIEWPDPEAGRVERVIAPGSAAVASSGTYRQNFEIDGRRYSHTIDPRTGYPVGHAGVAVTVIAPTAMAADGLATALGVLDPDAALAFAERNDVATLLMRHDDVSIRAEPSTAFAAWLER